MNYQQALDYLINKSMDGLLFKQVVEKFIKENSDEDVSQVRALFESAKKDYPNFEDVQSILLSDWCLDKNYPNYYIVDQINNRITTINAMSLKSFFNHKSFNKIQNQRLHTCYVGYNPDSSSMFFREFDLKHINLYRPAPWQVPFFYKEQPLPVNKVMPEIYTKFLNHLTGGNEKSIYYLINFLASTIQPNKKSYTYCTMLGGMGVGKGVLSEILEKLVGTDNHSKIPANKLSDIKFNAPAKNKKLIFLDELEVRSPSDENALKHFVNPTIHIEEKGKDARNYKNYANILIASNDLSKLKIEKGDRRYSMIDMGKETLIKFVDREYGISIKKYVDQLLDDNNIRDLGTYLLNYEIDDKSIMEVLQSDARRNQDLYGLSEWELCLFREVAPKYAGKEIPLSEAKNILREMSDNSKVNPGRESWKKLEEKFPGFFKRIKKVFTDGRQVYHIKFEELDKQPKFLVSEKED